LWLFLPKSRWKIENPGFNDAKNLYGFEPICHHERGILLLVWLLTGLALTIERLYRIRYLRRSLHPVRAANDLLLFLHLSLERQHARSRTPVETSPAVVLALSPFPLSFG